MTGEPRRSANLAQLRRVTRSDSLRSGLMKIAALALSTVMVLASTRLTFDGFGSDTYAAMMLTAGMFALLPFADLGTGAAITNALASSPDPQSDPLVRQTVDASARLLLRVTAVLIVLGCALAVPTFGRAVLGDVVAADPSTAWGVGLAMVFFALSLPLSLAQRVLLGQGRNYVAVGLQVLAPVMTLVGVWTASALAWPAWVVVSLPGFGYFAVAVAMTVTVAAMGWRYLLPRRADLWTIRVNLPPGLLSTAVPMVIISVSLAISYQSDRLVLSHVLDTDAVAEYSLAAQVYGPVWSVIASAGLAMWPLFQRLRAQGRDLSAAYRRGLGFAAVGGVVAGSAVTLLGPTLGGLLSGGALVPSAELCWAFAALVLVQSAHLPTGMLLNDQRGLQFQSRTTVLTMLANLPASFVLAGTLGASGPVWSSVATTLVCQAVPCRIVAGRRIKTDLAGDEARWTAPL